MMLGLTTSTTTTIYSQYILATSDELQTLHPSVHFLLSYTETEKNSRQSVSISSAYATSLTSSCKKTPLSVYCNQFFDCFSPMFDSKQPVQKINFVDQYHDLFHASSTQVESVHIPKLHYLSSMGTWLRNDADGFRNVIQWVQGIAYSLKFGLKRLQEKSFTDYLMPPSEAIWSHLDKSPEEHTRRVLLLQPMSISTSFLQEALSIAASKHPESPLPTISCETLWWHDALQMMHLGPYKHIEDTTKKIVAYAKKHTLTLRKDRHEVYLNDPRKTRPEFLQTIIRFSIISA